MANHFFIDLLDIVGLLPLKEKRFSPFQIVNPERAKQYAELYSNREVYEYEGGHHVPSSGETSTIIRQFLTKFLTEE